jgi:hypothetical protein
MTTPFSAAAQALGYLFQARRALYILLRGPEESELAMERLDDLELIAPGVSLSLEQLKHHITAQADLTDSSSGLWKTLRVWSTHLGSGEFDPRTTTLSLITTGTAPSGSIASLLREDGRDEETALLKLVQVARTSDNRALQPSFQAFLALSEGDQKSLLAATRILDGSPNILAVAELIKDLIRYATRPQYLEGVYERLEGWWFAQVAQHLVAESTRPVSRLAVHEKLATIADQFREGALPIDFLSALPDDLNPESDQRLFVRQLREVTESRRRIELAIIDYYRAYEQRSKWLREDLLIDADLEAYHERLVVEWERYTLGLADERPLDRRDASACKSFGAKVLQWADFVDIPIRPYVTEGYVTRGSYHILADMPDPRVWWHPLFIDKLRAALSA